ncbi:hypothetical protein [Gorillibacterium sp. sgz500922]|uniref:hypothetical protein n=1 Tax=Gorillibacterium sp. sgz500922 TaxID=3446694 RepID=UPI003F66BE44
MLTFAEKEAVIGSFAELTRREVSMGRVNYHYEGSVHEKKIVVYHLHPNGNGFVYAGLLEDVEQDAKGFVNIREYGPEELRALIRRVIRSLGPESPNEPDEPGDLEADGMDRSLRPEAAAQTLDAHNGPAESEEEDREEGFTELREVWRDAAGHTLELHIDPEDGSWYVFAGDQVDSAFETEEEALLYLQEEGFARS